MVILIEIQTDESTRKGFWCGDTYLKYPISLLKRDRISDSVFGEMEHWLAMQLHFQYL